MSKEQHIPEKDLADAPESIPTDKLKIIIEQTKTCICKIECKDGGTTTGFLCNIPIPDKFNQLVLITNNHAIKEEHIKKGNTIKFSLDNEELYFEIKIEDDRRVYTSNLYDITIIEIKEKDGLNLNSFLEIDNQVFQDNPNYIYGSKTVYLIHYPQGKEPEYSIGVIKSIEEDNFTFRHLCRTEPGSSGCPIINLANNRVIGVHKGAAENGKNWNLGTFIQEPILKFISLIKDNINNKIDSNLIEGKNESIIKEEEIENDEITIVYDFKSIDDNKKFDNDFIEKVKKELGESVS